MKRYRKSAFLILRLPQEIKDEIVAKAKEAGQTISQYVRQHIEKILHG